MWPRRRTALRLGPRYHDPDWWLLAILLTLAMFGTVMIFSATSGMAPGAEGVNSYLVRHLIYAALGLAVMVAFLNFDYHYWRPLALPALVSAFGLLIALLVLAPEINGAQSWFDLGPIQLQPSELAKPAIIIYLASWLCTKGDRVRDFSYGLLQFGVVMGFLIFLVMMQPDMGTSLVLATIGVAMFFIAGAHVVQFFLVILSSGVVFVLLALSAPYRRERVLAFLDPEASPDGVGWHLLQARLALGDGGLFGVGLGASRQKFTWLPEPHNDAIFAVIGEELGLVGAGFVLFLFGLLGYRGYRIARQAPDQFGMLMGVGITTWLIFQAVFNIGGVTSVIPFTGITLPFISYGGSSLIVTFGAVGILLNISRQTVRLPAPRQAVEREVAQPATAMMAAARFEQVAEPSFRFDFSSPLDGEDARVDERWRHTRIWRTTR